MRKNPLSNMSAHGGIITSEFLEIIRGEKVANPLVQPESFATFNSAAPKNKTELDQWIVDSWDRLRECWDSLSNRYLKMNVSDARSKWMVPFFKELGFDPGFIKEDLVVDGDDKLRFRLSHRGWISAGAPMLHTVAPSQDLEEAGEGAEGEVVRRGRSRSPHDELQAFLNVTKGSKWGIVTNGILLRILREYYHTTTKGYVEFDIENIFRERSFTDFRALYRMVHASRFVPDKDDVCPLEQFYKESVAAGVTVGENLRRNVKKAIEALGNGFLTPELAKRMVEDEEFCKAYYSELLRLVYRLLFLLFAEQRAMLPTRDSLYAEEYSITRLREMAEIRHGKDDHIDVWEGLKVTFHMLKRGCPPLKVFGYNGSLFDDFELEILSRLACKNKDALEAIRNLTLVEEERVLKRINYLDLGVGEIGSIYESLLDYTPKVFATEQEIKGEKVPANAFVLDPRGATRKTSGSYYTSPRLIDELIESALKPVVEDRVSKTEEKEKALLSTKVCDPACGSGAFLIAANNFLARELAKLRTHQAEPSDKEVKKATRDVLQHCIYGVDMNPMATELAKVSLWINSCVEDMPLNFLDHHIKCGNSLIGASPELLIGGLPDEAFTPVESDDKDFAKQMKSKNAFERKNKLIAEFESVGQSKQAKEYGSLDDFLEKEPEDVEEKKERYNALINSVNWQTPTLLANAWTAAFFWQLDGVSDPPTEATFRLIKNKGIRAIEPELFERINALAKQHRFFHWQQEFPDIFSSKEDPGFDVVIGNPPWERIAPVEKEFFAPYDSEIAESKTTAERERLIKNLENEKPQLFSKWMFTKRSAALENKFIACSGRFPLTSSGDINTYRLFAELATNILASQGLIGMVLKTGIVNAQASQRFIAAMIEAQRFVSIFDMTNKLGWFPSVIANERFCLTTMSGKARRNPEIKLASYCITLEDLKSPEHSYSLSDTDILLMSPQSKTLPTFVSSIAAEITRKIYSNVGVLVDETKNYNPWQIRYVRMLDSSGDSALWSDNRFEELISRGFEIDSLSRFHKDEEELIPLYEGKFIHIYNHRFGTFDGVPKGKRFGVKAEPIDPTIQQLMDPEYEIMPRYWVNLRDFEKICKQKRLTRPWMFALRNVCRGLVDARTTLGCISPTFPATHSAPILLFDCDEHEAANRALFFAAMWSSIVFDFVVRQKLYGANLQKGIIYEIAAPPPSAFLQRTRGAKNEVIGEKVKSLTLELVFVTNSLAPFARACGFEGPPFKWNPERRAQLRMELDAIFMHLYGLSRDDAANILDTFPIIRKRDEAKFGEYRTKFLILKYYDEYSLRIQSAEN